MIRHVFNLAKTCSILTRFLDSAALNVFAAAQRRRLEFRV
jgi:hypothetical protein